MSEITVKLICYSTNHLQTNLATFQVHIPKFLLAEINTHRVFSRSYNSARAIPARTMRRSATFEPDEWLSNKPGMEGGAELTGWRLLLSIATWRLMTAIIKIGHSVLQFANLHKQYTNRWLEPVVWVDGVISSTDWANFLRLRNHPSAQPEMRILASLIEAELATSQPDYLEPGEWHLPYIDADDVEQWKPDVLMEISAARCARVSYGFTDKKDSLADLKRAEKLFESDPPHMSPAEHVAQCPSGWDNIRSGNYRDWIQFRKVLENS